MEASEQLQNDLSVGDSVSFTIIRKTPLGYLATLENGAEGLLFKSDVFEALFPDQLVQGYIKSIDDMGRIALTLTPQGYLNSIDLQAKKVLAVLRERDGFIALTDQSSPQSIQHHLGMSKKAFKRVIGGLYRNQFIAIEDHGIRLISN